MGPKKRIGVGHEKSIRQYLARSATVSKGFGYGHCKVYDTEDSAKAAAAAWLAEIAKAKAARAVVKVAAVTHPAAKVSHPKNPHIARSPATPRCAPVSPAVNCLR